MSSGVYLIRNLLDGKVYVGSAVDLPKRERQHWTKLRSGKHFNAHLQAAWRRDGEDSFVFRVVAACEPDRLLEVEQRAIDTHSAADRAHGYNGRPLAASNKGRRTSEETKAKLRAANLGKKQSPETLAKKAARKIGRAPSVRELAQIAALTAMKIGKARPDIRAWAPQALRKFSDAQAAEIRRRYSDDKLPMRAIAEQMQCSDFTIHRIIHGRGICYAGASVQARGRGRIRRGA